MKKELALKKTFDKCRVQFYHLKTLRNFTHFTQINSTVGTLGLYVSHIQHC